jgi:hypothetical protein
MTTKPQYPSRWKVALAARVSSLRSFTYAFKSAPGCPGQAGAWQRRVWLHGGGAWLPYPFFLTSLTLLNSMPSARSLV